MTTKQIPEMTMESRMVEILRLLVEIDQKLDHLIETQPRPYRGHDYHPDSHSFD